jgi:putative tryptophan/tyrosine transport system permease protein
VQALLSFLDLIPITLAQSLIYSSVALGVMLPFRILGFPDMTAEGAFPLGGAICGLALMMGLPPGVGMLAAAAGGFCAGCTTAFIHLRFRINSLLAGILVMTMLYSINLHVLGRPNIALFSFPTIFSAFWPATLPLDYAKIVIVGVLMVLGYLLLLYLLRTERGVGVRAVGSNPEMAEAYGVDIWKVTIVGVGVGGACSAFGGSLLVQSQGFVDVGMGAGVLVNSLAALIIGEAILGRRTVARQLAAPIVGSIAYSHMVSACLALGLPPSDLRFATGFFVLMALGLPAIRTQGSIVFRERIRA